MKGINYESEQIKIKKFKKKQRQAVPWDTHFIATIHIHLARYFNQTLQ